MQRRLIVCSLTLAIESCIAISCAQTAAPTKPPQISVSSQFECLWWNERQMEGMDPNNPPPKETRVELKRWEYTDPVGVPHPDTADVTVKVRNDSDRAIPDILVTVAIQWSEGAVRSKASAKWGGKVPLEDLSPFPLAPGESRIVRVPVNIAAKIASLSSANQWPWSLRAAVEVRASGMKLGTAQAELPIIPGD